MKNVLAILFAALILLSGMHPALSTHYCCGSVAAVKWSFSGDNASCGMPEDKSVPVETIIKALCCHNEKAVYSTDENYTPSSFHFNLTPEFINIFTLPAELLFSEVSENSSYYYTGSPPGDLNAGTKSLSGLCTFRI